MQSIRKIRSSKPKGRTNEHTALVVGTTHIGSRAAQAFGSPGSGVLKDDQRATRRATRESPVRRTSSHRGESDRRRSADETSRWIRDYRLCSHAGVRNVMGLVFASRLGVVALPAFDGELERRYWTAAEDDMIPTSILAVSAANSEGSAGGTLRIKWNPKTFFFLAPGLKR